MKRKTIMALACAAALSLGCTMPVMAEEKHAEVAFFWITSTLDPSTDYTGWVLSRLGVGESLLTLNDDLELEGCIADEWTNKDELTWEFHIRDNVAFSNGNPVTAEAVKASLERAIANNTRAAEYLKVESMEADGQTLTIKTTEPNAALLNNLVEPVFNIIDTTQSEESIQTAPIATGPYVITGFEEASKVELAQNESYWNGEAGLDTITVTQIADANARAMALQSGETDLTNTIDNKSLELFTDEETYTISSIISPRVQVAYMNNGETSPLNDVELRKAVSYAVDRESYANLIGGSPAHSAYSDATPFGNENLEAYTYDPEKAVAILDEAGYADTDGDGMRETPEGEAMTLRFLQSADHGSSDSAILAQAIQSDLKNAGINMEIQSVENMSDLQASGEFDFYTANDNSAPTGDPQVWLKTMYTKQQVSGKANLTQFADSRIDDLVAELDKTFETEERYQLAQQASEVLIEDAANLYLVNVSLNMVGSAKLDNVRQPVCDYYFITKDLTLK